MDWRETSYFDLVNNWTILLLVLSTFISTTVCVPSYGTRKNTMSASADLSTFHYHLFVSTSLKTSNLNTVDSQIASGESYFPWLPEKQLTFSRLGISPTSTTFNKSSSRKISSLGKRSVPVGLPENLDWKKKRKQRIAKDLTGKLDNIFSGSSQIAPAVLTFQCSSHLSCNKNSKQAPKGIIERPPCRCDSLCHKFNDCCHFVSIPQYADNEVVLYSTERNQVSCVALPRPLQEEFAFMVVNCPTNTPKELAEKCLKNISEMNYSPILDIPVVSREPHVMYQNIFCAKCNDADITGRIDSSLLCQNSSPRSWSGLKSMEYKKGQLQWQKNNELCSVQFHYSAPSIRWCPHSLVNTCLPLWSQRNTDQEIVEDCFSRTYFVKAMGTYYNNPSCVLCNDVNTNEIECLNSTKVPKRSSTPLTYNPTSPFCESDQVWNDIYETCEVTDCGNNTTSSSCSSLNETLPDMSTIDKPCTVLHIIKKSMVTYPNGSIYLRASKLFLNFGEYEFAGTWITTCKSPEKWTPTMFILSKILLTISLVCLALHMAIFIYLPKRRNIPSMNLFSLVLALFLSELIFLCFFHYTSRSVLCVTFAALLYYFLAAAFLWMNVLSIDIWRTFRSSTYQIKSRKVFIQYSLYAWGVPTLPTVMVVLIDRLASKDFSIIPGFASQNCWFSNMWGHAVFFTIPAGMIVIINMFFYACSVWGIYKQHKLSELASRSVQQYNKQKNTPRNHSDAFKGFDSKRSSVNLPANRRSTGIAVETKNEDNNGRKNEGRNGRKDDGTKEEKRTGRKTSSLRTKINESDNFFIDKIRKRIRANRKNRLKLALYSKLALIMGMTWIFAFMSLHTKSVVLEYLFIIFNGTQGMLIFLAFDCKAKIWHELQDRLQCYRTESFANDCSKDFSNQNETYTQTEGISFQLATKQSVNLGSQCKRNVTTEEAV